MKSGCLGDKENILRIKPAGSPWMVPPVLGSVPFSTSCPFTSIAYLTVLPPWVTRSKDYKCLNSGKRCFDNYCQTIENIKILEFRNRFGKRLILPWSSHRYGSNSSAANTFEPNINTNNQKHKKTLFLNHIITFGCQEYSLTENSNVDSPIISGGKVYHLSF